MKSTKQFMRKLVLYQVSFILLHASLHASEIPVPVNLQPATGWLSYARNALGYVWSKVPSWRSKPAAPVAIAANPEVPNGNAFGAQLGYGLAKAALETEQGKASLDNVQNLTAAAAHKISPQARAGVQRVANDFAEMGARGGAKGVVTEMTDIFLDRAGYKIQEKIVDPAIAKVKKEIAPDILRTLLIGAGVVGCGIVTWYVTRIIANKFEQYMNRPRIDSTMIKASSDTVLDKDSNSEPQASLFNDMVFAPAIENDLNTVLRMTWLLKQKMQDGDEQETYRNLLLYGPPGSGKRTFAQRLAQHANMDFHEILGSALTKFEDGGAAVAIEDFINNTAQKSANGAVIYIDNASMLFTQQRGGDQASISRLIHTFTTLTQRRSNKYMVVLATPLKPHLAGGVASAMDDIIEIKRPELEERIKILHLFKDRMLLGSDVDASFAESVQSNLSDAKIRDIATKFRGATPGEMHACIKTIKIEAQLPSQGVVSSPLIDRIVKRAVAKYQELLSFARESHAGIAA